MIRKLRTERDNQQWMLDLALNMRGRVQNFERDDLETGGPCPPGMAGDFVSDRDPVLLTTWEAEAAHALMCFTQLAETTNR